VLRTVTEHGVVVFLLRAPSVRVRVRVRVRVLG